MTKRKICINRFTKRCRAEAKALAKSSASYTGTGLVETAQNLGVDEEKLSKPPKDVPRMLS